MNAHSFIPHIIYENNNELYIGYSEEIDVRNLFFNSNESTIQEKLYMMYAKVNTFEDLPIAFMEFNRSIISKKLGPIDYDIHKRLEFRSLADLLCKKSPVTVIDMGYNYGQLWSTQYSYFKNLTDGFIVFIEKNTRHKVILPSGIIGRFEKGDLLTYAPDSTPAVIVGSLLDQEISSSTS